MSLTKDQVLAALKKLGAPSSPTAIANELGVEPAVAGYQLRALLDAKVLKATGNRRSRIYGLPDQDFDGAGAPPQERKKPRRAKAARKAPSTRTAELPKTPAPRFIPAVDAERRLVLVKDAGVDQFTEAQTEAIASLLFQHYEA